jgi:hypothetical protein
MSKLLICKILTAFSLAVIAMVCPRYLDHSEGAAGEVESSLNLRSPPLQPLNLTLRSKLPSRNMPSSAPS